MRWTSAFLVSLLGVLTAFQSFSQQTTLKPQLEAISISGRSNPNFVYIKPDVSIAPSAVFVQHKAAFGLGPNDQMQTVKTKSDDLGFTHHRYQQFYNGIKVEGGEYIVHERNGRVEKVNGRVSENLNLNTVPVISESFALRVAKEKSGGIGYAWEYPENEEFIKTKKNNPNATFFPTGELVITQAGGVSLLESSKMVLAWKFDVYDRLLHGNSIYVDAITGLLVKKIPLQATGCHNGSVTATKGLGPKTVVTNRNFINNKYTLKTDCGGIKVETKFYNYAHMSSANQPIDWESDDNVWDITDYMKSAATSHWMVGEAFKYFKDTWSMNSYDGNGSKIDVLTSAYFPQISKTGNPPKDTVIYYQSNASFSGSIGLMAIGDGSDCSPDCHYNSLDVIGHELTHGIVQHTAGLLYQNESGALNESFADIFGNAFEYHISGVENKTKILGDVYKGIWTVGEDVSQSGFLRLFQLPRQGIPAQPNARPIQLDPGVIFNFRDWRAITNDPNSGNDYGGVHTNSGVQNFWFYLLVKGGKGKVNDIHGKYSFSGIGYEKALQITWRNLTNYLTSTADYPQARDGALSAAIDLFGICSKEHLAVANAWYAVGVGGARLMIDSIKMVRPNCGHNDGSIFLKVQNEGAVSFDVRDEGNSLVSFVSTGDELTVDSLSEGTYTISIEDVQRGCTRDTIIRLKEQTIISVDVGVEEISACGKSDGRISVTVKDFFGGVTFEWSNNVNFVTSFNSPNLITRRLESLKSGNYGITVRDDVFNCDFDTIIELKDPDKKLTISGGGLRTRCQGKPLTPATLIPQTNICGTGSCTYDWSTGESTRTIRVSSNGNYSLTVTNSDGCSVAASTRVSFRTRDCSKKPKGGSPGSAAPEWDIPIVQSFDPNDIIGPEGYGDQRWVSVNDILPYTIRFENDPDFATAPAQKVVVKFPLPDKANPFSFRLADFGFGSFHFSIPPNRTNYTERLDLRDSLGIFVDLIAGLDVVEGEAFWIFESIDPATGLPPADPMMGFLAINDTATGSGEGYVNFTIRPKNTSATGDSLIAYANIFFDLNDPILTPEIFNIIDAFPPVSSMTVASNSVMADSVVLNWTAQDDPGGSGVRHINLYYSVGNSAFSLLESELTGNSYVFYGIRGESYRFFSQAVDTVNNPEPLKNASEVTVELIPDVPVIVCDTVRNNVAINVATTSAVLTWDTMPGAYRYQIRGKVLGATNWVNLQTKPNPPTNLKIAGLVNNTTYIWQVRAVCNQSGTEFGEYSALDTFRTGCFMPQNLATDNIATTSATISWNRVPGCAGYQIAAKKQGTQNWTIIMVAGANNTSRNFTGLLPGTTYRWTVRTWCDTAGVRKSDYAAVEMFTTLTAKEEAELAFATDKIRIQLYPNPNDGRFKLEIDLTESAPLEVLVFDTKGGVVFSDRQPELQTVYNRWIDLYNVPAGLYLVQIKAGDKSWYRKVVKN